MTVPPRILIAEDDHVSRRLMEGLLAGYGACDSTADGGAAVAAFARALDEGRPYQLVALDIMMPVLDGQGVLRAIRDLEARRGRHGLDGCRVLMTTALDDNRSILQAFRAQAEAYLTKPIDDVELQRTLAGLGFAPVAR